MQLKTNLQKQLHVLEGQLLVQYNLFWEALTPLKEEIAKKMQKGGEGVEFKLFVCRT